MIKKIICIECPKGCSISVNIKKGKISSLKGNECQKGLRYATSEVESPLRVLTSTVLSQGLPLKMIPVRTDRPIPKRHAYKAAKAIKKIRIAKPVLAGDVLVEDFLGLGVNLIATRASSLWP